jgi:hypothetical protein
LPGNLTQANNSYITNIMLPISAVGTDNEENREKYEEDIRNVV